MNSSPEFDPPAARPGLRPGLAAGPAAWLAITAVAAFQLAFEFPALCVLLPVSLGALFALRRLNSPRVSLYLGMAVGLGVFVPQMLFLWRIFSIAAVPLWLILAFFHGLFLLVLNRVEFRWGSGWALALAPVLWCGVEYFRSEIWWLRFSWFAAGTCLPPEARGFLVPLGVYGCGALAMMVGALGCRSLEMRGSIRPRWMRAAQAVVAVILLVGAVGSVRGLRSADPVQSRVSVAGVQMEFPGVPEVRFALERLRTNHPLADLVLLSEYTFDGPVPDPVKAWCRRHGKWLVAGGKDPMSGALPDGKSSSIPALLRPKGLFPQVPEGEAYFNTAFVINPQGEVAFTQAKSRPIQFFRDGEPARERRVWESPWGRFGIPICYDASYRRVTDDLVRQGVQGLLIPTMDVEAWGERQHRLNARMARLRAVEYQLPVFRVASSGISQLMEGTGRELATAPFPGNGEEIFGTLELRGITRRLPLDAWVAPASTVVTAGVMVALVVLAWGSRWQRRAA